MKKLIGIGLVVLFGLGVSVGYGIGNHEVVPSCPTEDSCSVDYVNPDGPGPEGYWTGPKEVTL